ncbi:MAG: SCO family protein [Sediminibacterium sp.]|nr:SCO family protein [Sediminibacterium sp.]
MKSFFFVLSIVLLCACRNATPRLPILGKQLVSGKDSIYPVIANFSFINQDSQVVTNQTFSNKIYIADFIFLSCPTICPKMTNEMYQVYLAFATDDRVGLISHSIDPERDTIPRLKAYAHTLGVSAPKWNFVTGNQDSIMHLAEQSYFSIAYPDSTAPGGFTHSGGLLLIDQNRHIRGVYDGTRPQETLRLIEDIHRLLKQEH